MKGVRVQRPEVTPPVVGTIVNENPGGNHWPRQEASYDVLWDNGTTSRRVALSIVNGWLRRDLPRVGEGERKLLVHEWNVARCRELERQYRGRAPAASAMPSELPVAPAGGGMEQAMERHMGGATALASASVIRQSAKALLEKRFAGTAFAVHCERHVLSASWMDGPLAGSVWKTLSDLEDGRAIRRVKTNRAMSELLVQVAIDYCLWRVCTVEAEKAQMAVRLTTQWFLEGGRDALRAHTGPASGMAMFDLVRCVTERWDDREQVFRSTRRTQGLIQEMAVMFPEGDAAAAQHMRLFRSAALGAAQKGREALTELASRHVVRERP